MSFAGSIDGAEPDPVASNDASTLTSTVQPAATVSIADATAAEGAGLGFAVTLDHSVDFATRSRSGPGRLGRRG